MRLGVFLVASSLALGGIGCAEHLRVQTEAAPNPFAKKPYFVLLPIEEKSLMVGEVDEKAYFAKLDASHRAVYPFDRKAMREAFTRALVARALKLGVRVTPGERPDGAQFTIRPSLRKLEPGSFGFGWVSIGSRADMVLTILGPDGHVLDELAIDSETPADDLHSTSGLRWSADATELGAMTAVYLKKRVYGGD